MSDEIRKIANYHPTTKINIEILSDMDKGILISDDIVWSVLSKKLSSFTETDGFLLDGYPRRIEQVKIMEENKMRYDLVVNLVQDDEVIAEKCFGRRVCKLCNESYNVANIKIEGYNFPPKKPKKQGICDKCGGRLLKRKDDSKEVVIKRLMEYKYFAHPIESYFQNSDKFLEFTAYNGINDFPLLFDLIKKKFKISE